jgi:hypothetical protein
MSPGDRAPLPEYPLTPTGAPRWELTSEGCAEVLGGPYRLALHGPSPCRGTLAVPQAIAPLGLTWRVTFPDDLHVRYGANVTVRINPTPLYQNATGFVYPVEEYG